MSHCTNPEIGRVALSRKVWTSLITNTAYLSGLLTLDWALKKHGTRYPLIALYTETLSEEGHRVLDSRRIPKLRVDYLLPSEQKHYDNEKRFNDCWSKLTAFSLDQYDRVILLDNDMLVRRNMDELMDVELDLPGNDGSGQKVFAASHACVCNPKKIPHYPKNWVPNNCAYTSQHVDPDGAQTHGAPASTGLGDLNSGLLVISPSQAVYNLILERLETPSVLDYDFPDQSLLSDLFRDRWVTLPYTYNALKTLRDAHKPIWRDDEVKNVHYIFAVKPWHEKPGEEGHETHKWWVAINEDRKDNEKSKGLDDGY